jgi:hypothetical protein
MRSARHLVLQHSCFFACRDDFWFAVVLLHFCLSARRDDFLAAASRLPNQMYYNILVSSRAATIFGSPLWGGLAACGRLLIGQMPLAFDTVCGLPLCGPLFNLRRIGYTFFGQ